MSTEPNSPVADGADEAPQDEKEDLKAKFREALAHKGRHDNPEGGVDAAKRSGGGAHGQASGKRTFRRKTG